MDQKQLSDSSYAQNQPLGVQTTSNLMAAIAFLLVVLLFVASGLSSLIYQVIWTRLLVLVFGSTTFATATVLAVFMGGLALGSFLAGKYSHRIARPFLWYGILEAIIGLWALLVPFFFDAAVPFYKLVWQHLHLSILPFSLLRFFMAAAILLVPTTCMGATLPLLSRFVTTSMSKVGQRVGTLYASNTLGAVAGAMCAGFWLLPTYGLQFTTITAAVLNFLLCAVVVATAPKLERARGSLPEAKPSAPRPPLSLPARLTILAFALSGAIAMVYEVAWTRTLLMVIGSTTYAFTIMLSTFLTGIFLGSLICARFVDNAKQPIAWFAVLQLLICLLGTVSLMQFEYLPWANLTINAMFPDDPTRALLVRFLLASAILMPVALCLGAIFPVVVKVTTRELETVGTDVGMLYSANTLGAISGSFLAGFALIPLLGVEKTLILASVVNLLIGVALLHLVSGIRPFLRVAVTGSAVVLSGWSLYQPGVWDKMILLSAQRERRLLFLERPVYTSFAEWKNSLNARSEKLFWEDGASSTVGVLQDKGTKEITLITNGHIDASDNQDMNTQMLASAYPLLLKPEAKDVCVIGWGSGVTVGTATQFPVQSITAIELEPAVLNASHFFHHINHKAEDNEIVDLEFNDGRNYLLATDRKFDVIISEPSNPWQAGVCNLFTREYFEICRSRLKPGGIFACWLQSVEVPPENLKGVLAGLREVFPYNVALAAGGADFVIIATQEPLKFDYQRLSDLMQNPKVAAEMSRININSPEGVLGRILLTPDGISRLAEGSEPNVDDTNRLEWAVGRTYENRLFREENRQLMAANAGNPWELVDFGRDTSIEARAAILAAIARQSLIAGRPERAEAWARLSYASAPSAEALRLMGIARLESGHREDAEPLWHRALELDPNHVETLQTRGMWYLQERRPDEARKDFLAVLRVEPENQAALYHMAQSYGPPLSEDPSLPTSSPGAWMKRIEPAAVLRYLKPVLENSGFIARHQDVLCLAAAAYNQLGDYASAEQLLHQYLSTNPHSIVGTRLLADIAYKQGRAMEASGLWFKSFLLGRRPAQRLFKEAEQAEKQGSNESAIELLRKGLELWPDDPAAVQRLQSLAHSSSGAPTYPAAGE